MRTGRRRVSGRRRFNQCCSQGRNPKAKDEAKVRTLKAKAEAEAWTLETKTKARTLESKANFKAKNYSQFNANIPHVIDMTIAPISQSFLFVDS